MPTNFTNQASISFNDITKNSNIVTGSIDTPLTVTKISIEPSYSQGSEITYNINLVNTSDAPLNDITVRDNLGSYAVSNNLNVAPLTYIEDSVIWFKDGVLQTAPLTVTNENNELVISGVSVNAEGQGSGNTSIIYRARVNEFAQLNQNAIINNTVSATSAALSTPVTANDILPVNRGIDLSIVKAVTPTVVPENGELTYTLTIENYGTRPTEAGDNVIVTDTFNPILNNIAVTLNGAAFADDNYTYNDGTFTTLADRITVPAATYVQNPANGESTVTPGTAVLTITGNI